ncbi:MAG: hypothetical protein V7750_11665 [Sneathiella sp.]
MKLNQYNAALLSDAERLSHLIAKEEARLSRKNLVSIGSMRFTKDGDTKIYTASVNCEIKNIGTAQLIRAFEDRDDLEIRLARLKCMANPSQTRPLFLNFRKIKSWFLGI